MRSIPAVAFVLLCPVFALAHDTWVQTNTNLIRLGDAVYVDLMLGNHGNLHRDFKLASKIDLDGCELQVRTPGGKRVDLKEALIDRGLAPKEGYWSAKFVGSEAGMYVVEHRMDRIAKHGKPVRSIRNGKTYFVASPSLDNIPIPSTGYERPTNHGLELIPVTDPVAALGPAERISVKLLLQGKPFSDAKVSFIPRGETLEGDFDDEYERKTDAQGLAHFVPKTGNFYLIVAHHTDSSQSGSDFESTLYTATLTLLVPETSRRASPSP